MSLLQDRKLKIWSSLPGGVVAVFQDSSAADADATIGYKFDNAFREGALVGGVGTPSDRLYVSPQSIESDYDTGRTFSFRISGRDHWWYNGVGTVRVQPNDVVEFYAAVPQVRTSLATPSWHLNDGTPGTKVRYFYGWIDTVDISAEGVITVRARDMLWRANDVRVERSIANGLTIPMVHFNLTHDNPDAWWSVKKLTTTAGVNAYGIGAPTYAGATAVGTSYMTVKEILEYFDSVYLQKLKNAEIVPDAAASIWAAGALDGLTTIPGAITLDNVGFVDAIKQVLQWVPNMRLVIDHQTRLMRLVQVAAALTTSKTTSTQYTDLSPRVMFKITNGGGALFSTTPGVQGFRWLWIPAGVPEQAIQFSTYSIDTSPVGWDIVYTNEAPPPAMFISGPVVDDNSPIIIMDVEAFPTLPISADTDAVPNSLTISSDLADVYTACKIVSVHQKTVTKKESWIPGTTYGASNEIMPAWSTAFESGWRPIDADREHDFGASGSGMPIYKSLASGTPNRWSFWVAYADSAYRDEHTADEWATCTMQFVTAGTIGNIRNLRWGFTILSSSHVSDIGDGRAGLEIRLTTGDITSLTNSSGAIGTTAVPVSGVIDRIAFTQNPLFPSTTGNNGRWAVGRKWSHVSTTPNTPPPNMGGSSSHVDLCDRVNFTTDDGTGNSRTEQALRSGGGVLFTNEIDRINNGGAFSFGGSIIIPHVRKNNTSSNRCDAKGFAPPKRIDMEYEVTTTEVRTARYPAAGHDGYAYYLHNLEREHVISASQWTTDDKQSLYDDFAHRWWKIHSSPHYRGAVSVYGAHEFGAWIDLGAKMGFTTAMYPMGSPASLSAFWPNVFSVIINFDDDTVAFGLDNTPFMRDLALSVVEGVGIKLESWQVWAQSMMGRFEQRMQCMAANRGGPSNPYVCDSVVAHGTNNVNTIIKREDKNNWANRLGSSGIGISNPTNSGSTTHGSGATQSVVRDSAGNYFGIGGGGGFFGGTTSGANFIIDPAIVPAPQGSIWEAQQTAQAALAVGGLQPVVTEQTIFSSLAASSSVNGSGNTVFVLEHSGLVVNRYVGAILSVNDHEPHTHRTDYTILSNTAGTITVTGNVGQAALGSNVIIWPKPAPRPNPDHFDADGYVAIDANGVYVVISPSGDSIRTGTLNTGTNQIDTAAGNPAYGNSQPLSWWHTANTPTGFSSTEAGAIAAANPSYSSDTDFDGFAGVYNLIDGEIRKVAIEFMVPDDLSIADIVTAKVYFRMASAAGAGNNIDIDWVFRAVASGEDVASGGTLVSGSTVASVSSAASGVMVTVSLGTIFAASTLSYDELVKGVIMRDAKGASDTFVGTLQYIGTKFTGKRKRV